MTGSKYFQGTREMAQPLGTPTIILLMVRSGVRVNMIVID